MDDDKTVVDAPPESTDEHPDFPGLTRNEDVWNIPVDRIEHNDWNPNDMDDVTFERLKEEVQAAGRLTEPIVVVPIDDDKFRIIGGAHRYEIVRQLEWDTIPANLLVEERYAKEDVQKFETVKRNVIHGKLTPEKMARLYEEMADKYGEESLQKLFGYTDKQAWGKLVKGVKDSVRRELPKAVAAKFSEAADKADTIEDLGVILNQIFAEHGETVDKNYMVFTYGGKEHIYIAMSKGMRKEMKKLQKYCNDHNKDINDIIAFGVMMTPCLAVNGVVKFTGKVASVDEIKNVIG